MFLRRQALKLTAATKMYIEQELQLAWHLYRPNRIWTVDAVTSSVCTCL